jgi:hypothetical protein
VLLIDLLMVDATGFRKSASELGQQSALKKLGQVFDIGMTDPCVAIEDILGDYNSGRNLGKWVAGHR